MRNSFLIKLLVAPALCMACFYCRAQSYEINLANQPRQKLTEMNFSGTDPQGIKLGVNNRYFERDGKPWFPLMGEFHYSRYPEQYWEEEIVKMKSAGISIVATYIFWNVHESTENHWNWTGMLNLRHFIELCKKHQMYVWIRIGPYDNAELINGGLPDWIEKLKGKRTNDPPYLAASLKLYKQIGIQTHGLFFKDGGPIIGTQLENEYANGEMGHISTLKQMAIESGITPVYFSVTANTVFRDNKFEVLPLQGAYPYRGWEAGGGVSSKDFLYGNDQWIMTNAIGKLYYNVNKYPKGLCEQGSGSQMTYPNRFVVDPGILEAHLQNQIGRGMNLVGYYMFQGGTQIPEFKKPDCPVSYDFQAPISEFGFERSSYSYLKILHNFIRDFGSELAPMQVIEPANPVRDENDTSNLRYIVRMAGNSGYVFLCNSQVRLHMPDRWLHLRLKLPGEAIDIPKKELQFKGGTTAILPFNMQINGALLKYATAQPLSKFTWQNKQVVFLTAVSGMNTELAFDQKTISHIDAKGWKTTKSDGKIFLVPGEGRVINIKSATGKSSIIILLSREQAENSWRTKIGNQEVMIISKANMMFAGKNLEMRQINDPHFSFDIFPALPSLTKNKVLKLVPSASIFSWYESHVTPVALKLSFDKVSPDKIIFNKPVMLPPSLSDVELHIDYLGGSAEARANDKILTDDLFNGTGWAFGLKRYIQDPTITSIEFKVLPWQNSITGVSDSLVNQIKKVPAQFKRIEVLPQYKLMVQL